MSIADLSFESRLRVTWTMPDFFRVAKESAYSLRSPDFTFGDGCHCLRLFRTRKPPCDYIGIELVTYSIDADLGRAVLYEVELKSITQKIDFHHHVYDNKRVFRLPRSGLKYYRDVYVPDGTLTVLCSLRSRKPGSPKSGESQIRVILEYRITGNLSFDSFPCAYVNCKMPAFFQLPRESRRALLSSELPVSYGRYLLRLLSDQFHIRIYFVNLCDPVPGRYVSYDVGLKSTTGEEIEIDTYGPSTAREFSISRSRLDALQRVHFPDGHLTLFCCMSPREPSSDKEALTGGVAKVLSDYKRLLLKGAESDACLVVGGKEFQVHRNVLRARSPVFEAMFDHEMTEKTSGRVVIDDLEPDCFQDFLEYLYTGRVESFCDDNAFGLYAAADKYDLPTLKSECVEFMRRCLSVDNFFDVITLALRHNEQDLLKQSVEFFKKNAVDIILTVKWEQFVSENGTIAYELLVKLNVPGIESKNALLP